MKVINNLGKLRKAILWENEHPSICNVIDKQIEIYHQLIRPRVSENKTYAMELKLPRNSSYYALLGVEYTPNDSSELKVVISLRDNSKELFQSKLVSYEEIYCGIPTEYGNAILNAVMESVIKTNWEFSGTIAFNLGAHSLIGSSEALFSEVARILIVLLSKKSFANTVADSIILEELNK